MRRVTAALATIAMVVLTVGLSAQAKPNFAGKWTLVPDANAAAAPAGGGRGGGRGGGFGGGFCGMECTIAQDATSLTVTRTTQAGETKAVYKLDGTESKNTQTFGQNSIDSMSKAMFDGSKLSITTTQTVNGNATEAKMSLSLDASGNLVVSRTAPGFQDPTPVTTTQTYKKGA